MEAAFSPSRSIRKKSIKALKFFSHGGGFFINI